MGKGATHITFTAGFQTLAALLERHRIEHRSHALDSCPRSGYAQDAGPRRWRGVNNGFASQVVVSNVAIALALR